MERHEGFPNQDHYALKAAVRRLIHKLGGVESAALVPGITFQKSAISNWQNPEQPSFPPIHVIAIWEADVADPIVSSVMAGLVSEGPHHKADPVRRLGTLTAETGDVARAVIEAATDGRLSENERRAICKEADELIDMAEKLKRDVRCDTVQLVRSAAE